MVQSNYPVNPYDKISSQILVFKQQGFSIVIVGLVVKIIGTKCGSNPDDLESPSDGKDITPRRRRWKAEIDIVCSYRTSLQVSPSSSRVKACQK